MTKSRGILPPRQPWTAEQLDQIRLLYPDQRTEVVAAVVGHSVRSTYRKAHELGILKSAAYLASPMSGRLDGVRGAHTRFKTGQPSWNKGRPFDAGGRSVASRFMPGQKPHNTMPVGHVRLVDGVPWVKIAEPKAWKPVHHVVWREHTGAWPPKGMPLVFRDRNPRNAAIENLELVTREELARRNSIHRYPPELRAAIKAVGKARRAIEDVAKR